MNAYLLLAARFALLAVLCVTTHPAPSLAADNRLDLKQMLDNVTARAEAGDAEAQYLNGTLYGADGAKQAAQWFLRAAQQGHAKAQARIGVAYDVGDGVARDQAEALIWLTRAANKGQKFAQYYLGRKYARGDGVTRSLQEAKRWFQASAEQNHAIAQFELARLLEREDRDQALRWCRASAERGHVDAQYMLAGLLDRLYPQEVLQALSQPGLKVELPPQVNSDRAEAKKWYQAAADGGHLQAQYYAARNAADQTEALKFYYLVAMHPHRDRLDDLKVDAAIRRLEQALGADGSQEAMRRAKKWLSNQPAREYTLRFLMESV